ncbi:MAG: tRNA (adenosine(37)-N6)-threonylcarbamoyltransferase complex ATPase subunit type 1 TsaE [Rubrivivax sp.]|nr:tRNA (adenosine(37)-N6)-threonylcarbamoyltransferase complex ATPase subunit type 1 TsaE [Rubrivivax sp.]
MCPSPQLLHEPLPVDVLRKRHAPILETRLETWPDEAACARCAQVLAAHAGLQDAYIELHGPLGAGKTTFVRHLLRALGVQGRIKSPTFAVLEPYSLPRLEISHFDFYRFNDAREWEDAGFRDLFAAPGLKLAEWPEKAAAVLPVADLQLHIEPIDEHRREVRLEARTARGVELLP